MKTSCIVLVSTFALILALFLYVDHTEAAPGRKSSSGGGGWFGSKKPTSNIGGGGWYGSNKKQNYGSSGYGGGTYKKKGGTLKTLKKAAVIGAVAYGGYQLGKLSAGFGGWGWGRQQGIGFNEWNRWREIDGFLCRETTDCNWVDPQLYCQDYELDFQPSALWFGGDVARIVGECACPRGMVFDDREMRCQSNFFNFSGTSLLLVILIPILVLVCCCAGAFCIIRKMFF